MDNSTKHVFQTITCGAGTVSYISFTDTLGSWGVYAYPVDNKETPDKTGATYDYEFAVYVYNDQNQAVMTKEKLSWYGGYIMFEESDNPDASSTDQWMQSIFGDYNLGTKLEVGHTYNLAIVFYKDGTKGMIRVPMQKING